jgi:hypothetical protein
LRSSYDALKSAGALAVGVMYICADTGDCFLGTVRIAATPKIGANGNWFINDVDTGEAARASHLSTDPTFTADGTTQVIPMKAPADAGAFLRVDISGESTENAGLTFELEPGDYSYNIGDLFFTVINPTLYAGDKVTFKYLTGASGVMADYVGASYVQNQVAGEATIARAAEDAIRTILQTLSDFPNAVVPTQANAENQLATVDMVNSSINAMAANRVYYDAAGNPFPTRVEAEAANSGATVYRDGAAYTPTKDDYFIVTADEGAPAPFTGGQTRWKYSGAKWTYDFGINDRPFTAAEVAALASGATKTIIDSVAHKIDTLTVGTVTTVAPGTPASASISVAGGVGTIRMSIPQGEKGEQGTNTVVENTSGIPLVMSPHSWNVGQEYAFSDGSYGQRFTGAITANANALNYELLISGAINMISQGGWVAPDNNGRKAPSPSSNVVSVAGDVRMECSIYAGTANAYLASKSNQARSASPYDVWVRYTKA